MENRSSIFLKLQAAVRTGDEALAREAFPIGTVIPDTWTSPNTKIQYKMPLTIVHYGRINTPEHRYGRGQLGVYLLRKFALPKDDCVDYYGGFAYRHSDIRTSLNYYYSKGCSSELLDAVTETLVPDRPPDGISYELPDKFFLPSIEELGANPYSHYDFKDIVWDYFKDAPPKYQEHDRADVALACYGTCWYDSSMAEARPIDYPEYEKLAFTDPSGTPVCCWTRSSTYAIPSEKWGIWWHGKIGRYDTDHFVFSYAPACVII